MAPSQCHLIVINPEGEPRRCVLDYGHQAPCRLSATVEPLPPEPHP